MSQTPFEHAGSLRIGTVDFVSPDEVKVDLDLEAPDSVALNAGGPRPFPRVNSYVLVPVDDGFLVGQIEWLTIERTAFPKRRGMRDFGLVDLPYPARKLSLNPVGTLRPDSHSPSQFLFTRGADALPSVGASVVLPTDKQLRSVIESGERRRVKIGTSPLASDADVRIDPNRLFGRHLAVLGNTGSGKSCSVAGLIRWSVEQAQNANSGPPNARFVVLDPNGEYSRAFGSDSSALKARVFKVHPEVGELALKVPLWFWNSAEWCSFTQASAKTQRPTLIHALRLVRAGNTELSEDNSYTIRRYLRTIVTTLRIEKNTGSPWASFPRPKAFYEKLEKWKSGLEQGLSSSNSELRARLQIFIDKVETLCIPRRTPHPTYDFTLQEVEDLLTLARDQGRRIWLSRGGPGRLSRLS